MSAKRNKPRPAGRGDAGPRDNAGRFTRTRGKPAAAAAASSSSAPKRARTDKLNEPDAGAGTSAPQPPASPVEAPVANSGESSPGARRLAGVVAAVTAATSRKPTLFDVLTEGIKVRQLEAFESAAAVGRRDPRTPAGDGAAIDVQMIESLANPAHRTLTITQRCEVLGISRATWYRHLEDPLFMARARQAWRGCVKDRLGEVMEALIESAVLVGRDGHRDRKLLLEMVGEYDGPAGAGGRGGGAGEETKPAGAGDAMSDEELVLLFEGREQLLPPGVQRRLGLDPDAHTQEVIDGDEKAGRGARAAGRSAR